MSSVGHTENETVNQIDLTRFICGPKHFRLSWCKSEAMMEIWKEKLSHFSGLSRIKVVIPEKSRLSGETAPLMPVLTSLEATSMSELLLMHTDQLCKTDMR